MPLACDELKDVRLAGSGRGGRDLLAIAVQF